MKIAGGCFGCLALMFMAFALMGAFVLPIVAPLQGDSPSILAYAYAWGTQVNGSCCCLSGVLAIVFLAIGFSGGNKDPDA